MVLSSGFTIFYGCAESLKFKKKAVQSQRLHSPFFAGLALITSFLLLVRHHPQTVGLLDGCKRKLLALSNSAELDEAEEARLMGLPALSWFQSQSYPTPEAIPAGF